MSTNQSSINPQNAAVNRPMPRTALKKTAETPSVLPGGGSGSQGSLRWTQNGRLVKILTPLPDPNALIIRELQGQEAISRLFEYHLEMYSESPNLDLHVLINQGVTIRIRLFDDDDDHGRPHDRYINGIVSEFAQHNTTPRFTHYRATVRPRFWTLTQSTDCRIFQDMAVPDIVEKVLKEHGISEFEFVLDRKQYNIREYCVQYRESAFNFLSRLMEEEGLFYYFVHTKTSHKLIFGDAPEQFRVCEDQPVAKYHPVNMAAGIMYGSDSYDVVTDLIVEHQLRPNQYALRDFDFMKADTIYEATAKSATAQAETSGGERSREIYDYPAEPTGSPEAQRENFWDMQKETDRYTKLRKEEGTDSQVHVATGSGNCRGFVTGHFFTLTEHSRKDFNQKYVLTSLETRAYQNDSHNEPGTFLQNTFRVIKSDIPFRPDRLTPIPVVQGSQTALVVGPPGEEIYTDKYGRIKAQFHWDRYGKHNENSSCWLRVGTLWAGDNWGFIQLPRIGQEVIVDFLEGDPDKPYVVGSFYNSIHMPPYALDSTSTSSKQGNYKTVSTRKSRSTLNGTPENYNEIRFEDLKGAEQLFIHAERDMDVHTKRDRREHILRDQHLIVERDHIEEIHHNRNSHISQDQTLSVGNTRSATIGSVDVVEAGQEIHLKAGNKIVLEAGSSITLRVGANFINVTSTHIFIMAPAGMVRIQHDGGPESGSGAQSGRKADVADDGPHFGPKK